MSNKIFSNRNWHKYVCPNGLSGVVINYVKDLMRDLMPIKKLRRFNKAYISCKRTETRVFYKILVFGNKNFVCLNMNQRNGSYKWYERDTLLDLTSEDLDDSYHIYKRRYDPPPLGCRWGRFDLSVTKTYTKVNDLVYKFIDSFKSSIPIREVGPPKGPRIIQDNKILTYMYLLRIKRSKCHKIKSKLNKITANSDLYVFKAIIILPKEIISHIFKLM